MSEEVKATITRAAGVTPAERFVAQLCEHTFLTMWSYPGIYRNQGNNATGEGKELCDLLVVFGNHIIILSDKDCEFPRTGNTELDWSRWYRKAIRDSAKQVWGAERWILNFPDRLFIDRACTIPLPVPIPSRDTAIIHRIVVAHAASQRCVEEFGGSGSLMIVPRLVGDDHMLPREQGGMPFGIGMVSADKGYIHVLDDTTLQVLMRTLDTITDFTDYLTKKERFIQTGGLSWAAGEDELLSWYLKHLNPAGEHDFALPENVTALSLGEGLWLEFERSLERQRQRQANEISYAWDGLIETFNHHAFAGTSYYNSHPGLANQERILRFLAREPRTRRRFLAEAFLDLIAKTPKSYRATRTMLPSSTGDPCYTFLVLPHLESIPYEEYREVRRQLLATYCAIARSEFPHIQDFIGIATESGRIREGSEDAIYLDGSDWTTEDQVNAERQKEELEQAGFLGRKTMFKTRVFEYPQSRKQDHFASNQPIRSTLKGRHRNMNCPCGSGKKYKKCCGR